MYDVVIIGAGVTGCCIARELSRYQLNACVVEKGDDVASGTSKANSGVIHSGFDAKPGSLMAKLNVEGNALLWELAEELDFPVKKNGALVVATDEEEVEHLELLLDQARQNGVPGVRILSREEVMNMEPNLTDKTVAALYAPTGGVIDPFNLAIAMGENANVNGVEFRFETEVLQIRKKGEKYELETNHGSIETKCVVNAAGVYADKFHNMVSEEKIHITARKGEYLLFDKTVGDLFTASVFPVPGKMGKGILIAPTVHGNLYVGPTANDVEDKESINTTQDILQLLTEKARANHLSKRTIPMNKVITSFSGLRAHQDKHDFIVQEVPDAEYFFDAAGIESPGLTSSPAIGVMMAKMVSKKLDLKEKTGFVSARKGVLKPEKLTDEERNELIKKNPAYGNIICRCEMITEGEIVDAIHRPLGAKSMDSIKRRTRAGMGRCQAGFCTPRTMEILSRELKIGMTEITKKGGGSRLVVGKTKEL
ncbi:NAD(P)/FAD-dependent oxidoreductase [Clostridium sp. KNHs216]|uniref:NAD(P)/FAD-dependent oxidoreductase n=1 Tax=Clostridium sp. KNHs216 TaxID=1550235 RepID=UPI00114D7051|nr:NAD(P)/FAD-dependent oxidoreductase [Clostridium sp. KNHs216]TQI68435.1 glycerol-3-phosphate dehydrogenase [Clostridium sp. KNHs216]